MHLQNKMQTEVNLSACASLNLCSRK